MVGSESQTHDLLTPSCPITYSFYIYDLTSVCHSISDAQITVDRCTHALEG